MQKVRFLHGFQGTETRNMWFEAGQVFECDEDVAINLVQNGRAMLVMEVEPEPVQETVAEAKQPRKRRK